MNRSEVASGNWDAIYKRLFDQQHMAEDFLRGVAPEEFLGMVDFGTLSQSASDFADGDLRSRRADRIWRVRSRDGREWVHLYIVLEFQSRPDPMMARRVLEYVLRVRDQAAGERGRSQLLPPVLPAVIHSGPEAWTSPTEYLDLVEHGGEWLLQYQTRQRYALVDLVRDADRFREGSALRALCLVAQGNGKEIGAALSALAREKADPEYEEFCMAFAEFAVLALKKSKSLSQKELDGIEELGKMPELEALGSVFEGSFDRAVDRAAKQAAGPIAERMAKRMAKQMADRIVEQARSEIKLEGMHETLNRLAQRKFGAASQGELAGLIAGIGSESRLDDALGFLLECSDPERFAAFLRQNSSGG